MAPPSQLQLVARFLHDIAIIKVSTELPCSRARLYPVCLPEEDQVLPGGQYLSKLLHSVHSSAPTQALLC